MPSSFSTVVSELVEASDACDRWGPLCENCQVCGERRFEERGRGRVRMYSPRREARVACHCGATSLEHDTAVASLLVVPPSVVRSASSHSDIQLRHRPATDRHDPPVWASDCGDDTAGNATWHCCEIRRM